jgi:hypothetical protein
LVALGQGSPTWPLRTLWRTTGKRLNPPRREVLSSSPGPAVRAALAAGERAGALASVTRERRRGPRPTLVLGGFVPDAAEQVYLLRGFLARQGSVYYLDYARDDFSLPLLAAQLDDLVAEIRAREGAAPVVVAVSFGGGVVLDWLRRGRLAGGAGPVLAGLVLVSPVTCAEDLLLPGEARPGTLLGRAVQPLLVAEHERDCLPAVERARLIFARMFEAGAQNKAALGALLTRGELAELRAGVLGTIAGVTPRGALARVHALRDMASPTSYLTPELVPLSAAPTLILYAEKEGAVIHERSPARQVLERACGSFFPAGRVEEVRNPRGSPVQHASLVFHVANFLPLFGRFYRGLKTRKALHLA